MQCATCIMRHGANGNATIDMRHTAHSGQVFRRPAVFATFVSLPEHRCQAGADGMLHGCWVLDAGCRMLWVVRRVWVLYAVLLGAVGRGMLHAGRHKLRASVAPYFVRMLRVDPERVPASVIQRRRILFPMHEIR